MPDLKVPFALVDGQLVSPQPGLRGICPASDCSAAVVARCGPQRAWHFAHIGQCLGGSTSGPETGWHLGWKCEFPVEWQEVVHHDQHGEKHIADVKTPDGWAIEIQHSPITLEERRSREAVYGPRLVWIVDALTRNGEREQFEKLWEDGAPVGRGSPIRRVSTKHCVRLQGWAGSRSQVIFDLGDDRELLWLFHLQRPDGLVYIANHLKRADLVELHRRVNTPKEQAFEAGLSHIINFIRECDVPRPAQMPRGVVGPVGPMLRNNPIDREIAQMLGITPPTSSGRSHSRKPGGKPSRGGGGGRPRGRRGR